jgi:hypothetical protein
MWYNIQTILFRVTLEKPVRPSMQKNGGVLTNNGNFAQLQITIQYIQPGMFSGLLLDLNYCCIVDGYYCCVVDRRCFFSAGLCYILYISHKLSSLFCVLAIL